MLQDQSEALVAVFAKYADRLPTLYLHASLDSTNTEAKRLLASGAKTPFVVVADRQTGGRGRMGRSFYSPAATGAYFSLVYTPTVPLDHAVTVTSAAAVAVMEAVREVCGLQTEIKWVNDLYYQKRKVCGILCESVRDASGLHIIVGIGVNLSTEIFPDELAEKAGSLGTVTDRAELIASVWEHLLPHLEQPQPHLWLEAYRRHSCVLGRNIEWTEGDRMHRGIALSIDARGGLEVRDLTGTVQVLRTGEISVLVK